MAHGRASRPGNLPESEAEQARIRARLEALRREGSRDATRKIGGLHVDSPAGYDGSLGHQEHPHLPTSHDVEPRAYLLTSDGGVLAELSCKAETGPIVIGRSRTADIRITDPYVHRQQAEIYWDETVQCHFIAHGGGENGTYVNRHRVNKPLRLVGGEQVRVGKTRLLYRIRR